MTDMTLKTDKALLAPSSYPADRNPAAIYLASLPSPASRRTMEWALQAVANVISDDELTALELPWGKMRYQHLEAIRARLMDDYPPSSVNTILAAIRGTLKRAWLLDYMTADEYQKCLEVKNVSGESLPAGKALTQGQVTAIIDVVNEDPSRAGVRDAAILCLLIGAGIRRSELASLDVSDYNPETGELVIRRGKGRKPRVLFASNGPADALADWLGLRGNELGALFWPINKGDVLTPRRMSSQAIFNICQKRGDQAGVDNFTPHDARRTFITLLLSHGVDALVVASLAGHASTDTTRRYDRRGDEAKKQAIEMLHLPYKKRKGT